MKLLIGAVAYLAAVAGIVAAAFAGLASIERRQPADTPILARAADHEATNGVRAVDDVPSDPNRIPVWIVPTAKYTYTPVPIDPRPKHTPVIGLDARRAMAKDTHRTPPRRAQPLHGEAAGAPAVTTRRDNDPFFRD